MVRRGDHTDDSYQPDNTTVWTIIRPVTHGGQGWSWVTKYVRSTNGRATYFALKAHYLGDAYVSRIRSHADKIMEIAFYDGKSRTFTFNRFYELLLQAYNDVEETGEEVTEERKMRTFLRGLLDPRCESAKNTILVTPAIRGSVADSMDMVAENLGDLKSFTNPAKKKYFCNIKC